MSRAVKFIFGADLRGNHAMLEAQFERGVDMNSLDEFAKAFDSKRINGRLVTFQ